MTRIVTLDTTRASNLPDRRAAPSPVELPAAEAVFAAWIVSVPLGTDIQAAAREQIARIDRRALTHPGAQYLRTLLLTVAGNCGWNRPFRDL